MRVSVPSTVRVTLSLGGRVVTASDNGVIRLNEYRAQDWASHHDYYSVNNHSTVTWELELAPGKTKNLGCEFDFYVYR